MTLSKQRLYSIVTDNCLSPSQKRNYLAAEAEASLPYPDLSIDAKLAKDEGIICDLFEGHAPYKPRYVLPDYGKFLKQGSEYLELSHAEDFDDAINMLTILYHHVPSVTSIPVYLGQLDEILLPYASSLSEEQIYKKLKHFWIMLDRTLPDAFMHANIGPSDNIICRTILRIDAELKQVAPNLTFMYDPHTTPQELLRIATDNICQCSKPHIANTPVHEDVFGKGRFGIVSCYNVLPLAGGANTLARINLKKVAEKADNFTHFIDKVLPEYCDNLFELIDTRCTFLHEKSGFFKQSFLIEEGLIEESRFSPMFGIVGMAEAVNTLLSKQNSAEQYGHSESANQLGYQISAKLAQVVESHEVKYGLNKRALLHAQGGIDLDHGVTPGVRIPYGSEPDPVTYIQATSGHHPYYLSGISDILTIDETVKSNPQAMYDLCLGAFHMGFREFTANVESNDLMRVTGYMVKRSELAEFKEKGSRMNTTVFASGAADNLSVLDRKPRVISGETSPKFQIKSSEALSNEVRES